MAGRRGTTRTRVAGGVLAASCLLLSACTSNGDEDVSGNGAAAVPSSSSPATSATTGLTVPTTSETAATSTTLSQEEQDRREIFEIHTRFLTEFFARDERFDDSNKRRELIRELAIEPLLGRSLNAIDEGEQDSEYVTSSGFASNVHLIEVDGDQAIVLDCSQDGSARFDSSGEVLVPPDEFFKFREVQLSRTEAGWRIYDFLTGGDQCDPQASPVLSY